MKAATSRSTPNFEGNHLKDESDKRIRVAFQGEHGAFSEEAVLALLGNGIETVPRKTFENLFSAIDEEIADYILAPVENTLAGTVHRCYELLFESDLNVIGEVIIPIRHQLIGCLGSSLQDIRFVESHAVALAQCEKFFQSNAHLERIATDDTAASIRRVAKSKDRTHAAIGSLRAAEIYGGVVLKENIEDHKENYTRFFLLSEQRQVEKEANKVSIVMQLSNIPGALYQSLKSFAERNINLIKLESHPIRGKPWEYRFYLDFQISENQKAIEESLEELGQITTELKILGVYKSANRGK
jgi:prephenate dehydratase